MANKFWKVGGCRVEELALPTCGIQLSGEVLSTDEAASAELLEAEAVHRACNSCRLFKAMPTTPCVCREQQLETGVRNKRLKRMLESYSTAAVRPSWGCSLPRCRTRRRLCGREPPGPDPHTTVSGCDVFHCLSEFTLSDGTKNGINLLLQVFHRIKNLALDWSLDTLKQPVVGRSQVRTVGWVEQSGCSGSVEEVNHCTGAMCRRVVMVQNVVGTAPGSSQLSAKPQVMSPSAHSFSESTHHSKVVLGVNPSAIWHKLTIDNASHIPEDHQHSFFDGHLMACLPRSIFSWSQPRPWLLLVGGIISKNPTLVTCYDSVQKCPVLVQSPEILLTDVEAHLSILVGQIMWHPSHRLLFEVELSEGFVSGCAA